MMSDVISTFILCWVMVPLARFLLATFGLFVVVGEREALVYAFSGKVFGVLSEPGPHCPLAELGWKALFTWILGRRYRVDTRLDQEYLRSRPGLGEEGAPMGVSIWYEFRVGDPEAYLFRNADPLGSMRASVVNSTLRCLSNTTLADMLTKRHPVSRAVRAEVAPRSHEWGCLLGSVYIRKVYFRDPVMIAQIEEKVISRLRQVTSSIRQEGANQVNLITSAADREAAVELARAAAVRPQLVGAALQEITTADSAVAQAMFEILELQRVLGSGAEITLVPWIQLPW